MQGYLSYCLYCICNLNSSLYILIKESMKKTKFDMNMDSFSKYYYDIRCNVIDLKCY